MKPTRIEYTIGQDRHGRTVKLIKKTERGVDDWSIISEPVNQRDEGEKIYSLTKANLEIIGEIARGAS